jgi:hypothetical protein
MGEGEVLMSRVLRKIVLAVLIVSAVALATGCGTGRYYGTYGYSTYPRSSYYYGHSPGYYRSYAPQPYYYQRPYRPYYPRPGVIVTPPPVHRPPPVIVAPPY